MQGRQTINRAELTAALLVHEQNMGIEVVTDSDYVISRHKLLLRCPDCSRLHRKKNHDLLARWHFLIWQRRQTTVTTKVKAHALLDSSASDRLAFRQGNDVADRVAKHAVASLYTPYIQQLRQRSNQADESRTLLADQFHLRTDLSQLRSQLLKQDELTDAWDPDQVANGFATLQVSTPQAYPLPDDRWAVVHASRYGTEFSVSVTLAANPSVATGPRT
eukprot:Skav208180  [mRNA]  locus=scaffold2530:151693:152349:- [translate_table: standard]